ncbi:MAG: alpha,alpha-phosphotrehalase [Mycoplasmatales bacterium]
MNLYDKVIYQIYPKSFKDTTANGMGDIKGITRKLPYLNNLGVDMIWISPIFLSPQVDNGYDVEDYCKIDPIYGNMDDVDKLILKAKEYNIDIMFDMVFNHTSTKHEWFQKALKGDKKYMDYYIFKDKPTNWESKFGGNAWEYVDNLDKYYLHLFDKTQADLNWENDDVKKELVKVLNFWLEKGIKGFRFDVINLISKPKKFLSDDSDGRHFYTDGEKVVEYLQYLNKNALCKYDTLTVGEMSSTSIENCIKYSNKNMNTLDMTFSFVHLKLDYIDNNKWTLGSINIKDMKQLINEWQIEMNQKQGVNALFWSNHDQPRIVSRMGNTDDYHFESATAIAATTMLLKGVPFIYQGEEIGIGNAGFTTIDDYKDIESINFFNTSELDYNTKLSILQQKSRDNGRTPMLWEEGFTTGIPWIEESKIKYSIETKQNIFQFYKKLVNLKKTNIIIQEGDFVMLDTKDNIFAFKRTYKKESIYVYINLSIKEEQINLEEGKIIMKNYKDNVKGLLRPFEIIVIN